MSEQQRAEAVTEFYFSLDRDRIVAEKDGVIIGECPDLREASDKLEAWLMFRTWASSRNYAK